MISYGWPPSYTPRPYLGYSYPVSGSYGELYHGDVGRPIEPRIKLSRLLECTYCGNKWPEEIRCKYHNCPTCAGSYK